MPINNHDHVQPLEVSDEKSNASFKVEVKNNEYIAAKDFLKIKPKGLR